MRKLVIGAGALGSRIVPHLLEMDPFGRTIIMDGDRVEQRNLSRLASCFVDSDIGEPKVDVIGRAFEQVETVDAFFSKGNSALLDQVDVVYDMADDLHLTILLDELCGERNMPMLVASVHRDQGMIYCLHTGKNGPAFRDLFQGDLGDQQDQCTMDLVTLETLTHMEEMIVARIDRLHTDLDDVDGPERTLSILDKGRWSELEIGIPSD